jgi:hypothetical protein
VADAVFLTVDDLPDGFEAMAKRDIEFVMVMYGDGTKPTANVIDLAEMLDERLAAVLPGDI